MRLRRSHARGIAPLADPHSTIELTNAVLNDIKPINQFPLNQLVS